MLHINPDKSLVQQPLRLEQGDDVVIPEDWLTKLGSCVADDVLQLDAGAKSEFIKNLNEKAGPDSTYTLKKQLHESLKVVYVALTCPTIPFDQKTALAIKLVDGVANCAPGFHNRVNETVASLSMPENLDELLAVQRQAIVSNAASLAVYELEKAGTLNLATEVHTYNRFFAIACSMGYGVRLLNERDIYHGQLSVAVIEEKLNAAFAGHYTVFQILNTLLEQIEQLVKSKGYDGRREQGYAYEDFQKFDDRFLKPFFSITGDQLFDSSEDEDLVPIVHDIHWRHVKTALLNKMRAEKYFIFTPQEEAFLKMIESDASSLTLSPEVLSLFPSPNELVQSLVFFTEWPVARKLELMRYYFANTKAEDETAVLEKLEKTPELFGEIKADPVMLSKYLAKAVRENKLDKVRALVASGADINPHLVDFAHQHKNPVFQWLMNDAAVRATITRESFQAITDTLIHSKKGRQILLMDERLRGMCPDMLAGKSMNEWMQQAEAEKVTRMRDGLFVPANPLVQQFLQHIIDGEQKEAKTILDDHQQLIGLLLTEKAKVKDYSGRKIYGTALQLAAGAEDVRYHENEICMVEMLIPYIKSLPDGENIMAAQIAEQFPEGYEEQEQQRIEDDKAALIKVLDAIGKSNNDAECEPALQEFDNYLKPKGVLRTGKHFNEKLQEKAYELYDARYDEFGGWNSRKNNLAWRRVNGRVQRNYTACLAQASSQGLYYIVDKGEKLQRTLELRYDRGVRFYPLDLNPASRLGVDYAIAGRASLRAPVGPCRAGAACSLFRFFKTLSSKKHDRWNDLCRGARVIARAGVAK